jgi:hypothetical protein
MPPSRLVFLACLLVLPALTGCPRRYDRRYTEPRTDEVLEHLANRRAGVSSFKTDSQMDYWVGKDRFRGTVLVMGTIGAKVRMNALRPDDAVAVDLACDGAGFVLVDQMNNCILTGPCNEESIASLLRVPLAPDDFLYLALGATPVIAGAEGKVRWDSKHGREVVELEGDAGMKQTILLDGRDGKKTWDVLRSEVKGPDGKVIWTADHTDYTVVKDEAGVAHRVPGKSNFKTPAEKSDLLVEWGKERQINLEIPPQAFELVPPPVAICGQKPAPTPTP